MAVPAGFSSRLVAVPARLEDSSCNSRSRTQQRSPPDSHVRCQLFFIRSFLFRCRRTQSYMDLKLLIEPYKIEETGTWKAMFGDVFTYTFWAIESTGLMMEFWSYFVTETATVLRSILFNSCKNNDPVDDLSYLLCSIAYNIKTIYLLCLIL